MVLGENPFGYPWGTHGVAGGTHKKFTGERMQMQGNKGNVRGRTKGTHFSEGTVISGSIQLSFYLVNALANCAFFHN